MPSYCAFGRRFLQASHAHCMLVCCCPGCYSRVFACQPAPNFYMPDTVWMNANGMQFWWCEVRQPCCVQPCIRPSSAPPLHASLLGLCACVAQPLLSAASGDHITTKPETNWGTMYHTCMHASSITACTTSVQCASLGPATPVRGSCPHAARRTVPDTDTGKEQQQARPARSSVAHSSLGGTSCAVTMSCTRG